MKRIPPSTKIRQELKEIVEGGVKGENLLSLVLQKGMQLIMQEMMEAEVTEYLGRGHYERASKGSEKKGYRNGYEGMKVRTGEGTIVVEVPQVRDTEEPYRSKLKEFFRGHTDCVQKLAAEMYARGLSTRDIEDALIEATGDIVLSRSSVSRVTDILWKEYEAFSNRDLSSYEVEYLFIDALYESVRKMVEIKEAILVAWAMLRDGKKVLLSIGLGNKESYESWLEFLRDMVKRGLRAPVTITSDGAPGCIRAIEEVFPKSIRIRCWVHRMRNFATKVPATVWPELKAEILQIRDARSYEEGKELAEEFIRRHEGEYPSLVKVFKDDIEALLGHLKVPLRHRKLVRTTNLIERSFVEERRRTKIIPGFLTEKSCLKLVFSVLIRASMRWQRVSMGEVELKQLEALRKKLGLDSENQSKAYGMQSKEAKSA